ncbi:MAG: 50S ribosomal protein L32e [Candidatus Woesearchaeota archaeon]|nr:50S ribosomal protein L32e [Candidatus Woesearchaeota archaeon]
MVEKRIDVEKKAERLRKLLLVKREKKRKSPYFVRKDSHKKKSLGEKWRRPTGIHNKLRLSKGGHIRRVSIGYRTPADVRGLDKGGLKIVVVSNTDLSKIDPKKHIIVISGKVGKRKKVEIVKKAIENGIKIMNVKDALAFVKKVEEEMKIRKEEKIKVEEDKKKKKEELKKKAKEKEKEEKGIEKAITEEEKAEELKKKKEEERKEGEKVLTKKV